MTYLSRSRRNFIKTLSTSTLLPASFVPVLAASPDENQVAHKSLSGNQQVSGKTQRKNTDLYDGPHSPLFNPITINGNKALSNLTGPDVSNEMAKAVVSAPKGKGTAWGIPFKMASKVLYLKNEIVNIEVAPFSSKWLIFLHTSDHIPLVQNDDGFYKKPFEGIGYLNEHIANYVIIYADGDELSLPIKERFHIGMFRQAWGENCIESVAHHKPRPVRPHHDQITKNWGLSQTRVDAVDRGNWVNWLWAWENPHPDKKIKAIRFEPLNKTPIILSAISTGNVQSNPLRWKSRQKAILTLPPEVEFDPTLDEYGLLSQIKLDLGQIISATPRLLYPDNEWPQTYNNKVPERSKREIIIEYSAHPDAIFHLNGQHSIPVSDIINKSNQGAIKPIAPANKKVKIRVVEKGSSKPVPVKFHAHGAKDEYLAPVDRHRQPDDAWFEDYSVDFVHRGTHNCTYIPGETLIKVPVGKVFIEISKGFEIKPIRKVVDITAETNEVTVEIEKVLNWREKGWVTADTHVHFLSTGSAMLEGSAEGINIVNLLASQWGELMTNVGDFDGKTTYGSKEAGGDGEYLVRVGTENRQHVMGHISLLGYEGNIIVPMTTGGARESAIGDPIEMLLTEWAQQCKKQDGVVILPHFPEPRLENAASIVNGSVDGVEMTSLGNFYGGINPYSLTDWYRYLNCGYFVAAVGGTDKMSAGTAVGTVRTYAKIDKNIEFSYDAWKESVRRGQTFVTYGPLVEFLVDGNPSGSRINMSVNGGTVDITWEVASITIPMTRVELIVNGEIRESVAVSKWKGSGNWKFKVDKSSWVALLVRGHYEDKPEIITAHTSPVMIKVKNSKMLAAADALTILEQIEGARAYLETIGTRADNKAYKRMRMVLESAHRTLHNRMHALGYDHIHTPTTDHPEHHH
ncbi:MAG: CehA/McbA family metallohydrolase [Chlorobi bacterium]|nr:CehA/McbA family metallohydrolase [Chlorobiota bacterium]